MSHFESPSSGELPEYIDEAQDGRAGSHGHAAPKHAAHGLHVHVMPLSVLFTIFGTLIVLTLATVIVSRFPLGAWEVPIAMTIATVKATLVAVYFMHLRYDNPFNAMVFVFSLLFVGLFLGGALMDVQSYQQDLIAPTPVEPAR